MSPFDKIQEMVSLEMQNVNALIYEKINSKNAPQIPEITTHLMSAGGKRLRPLLTLAAAKLFNYKGKNQILLAAVVEFIHTATLLHDDVIDESTKRRGRATANALWDNKSSVLVGDFLFSKSFQLMVETKSFTVLDVLAEASAKIAESEIIQLSIAKNLSTSQETYMNVVEGKTAALFSAACQVGGLISDASDMELEALKKYGTAIGISFQIIDDLLDYKGNDKTLGKNTGDDFREQKVTLPIIFSFKQNHKENRKFWERTITGNSQNSDDFDIALEILFNDGSLDRTMKEAIRWARIAQASLGKLPQGKMNKNLFELADFVIKRAV